MADQIRTHTYKFGDLSDFKTDHDQKFRYFLCNAYPNQKYIFNKINYHGTYLRDYGDYSIYQGKILNENIIFVTPKKNK